MKIAFLQMDCVEGARGANRRRVEAAIADAVSAGAKLLALPELWCSGYELSMAVRDKDWDKEFAWVVDHSKEIALLGGSLLEYHEGAFYNCAVAAENGRELNRYRKQHLFRPLHEHHHLGAGEHVPEVFEIAGLRAAMTICYDLRFPEVYRPLALDKADLIHVPAQWPHARIDHWRTLLMARAIESQCYVLGVNRRGWYGEVEFPGHSLLIDPQGKVIVDAGDGPGIYYGEVDLSQVSEWRKSFPVLNDRREDQYPTRA